MRIGVIILARLGSSRLPGKVLMKFGQSSVLAQTIERAKTIDFAPTVIVATTPDSSDDPIEDEALSLGVSCIRGVNGTSCTDVERQSRRMI